MFACYNFVSLETIQPSKNISRQKVSEKKTFKQVFNSRQWKSNRKGVLCQKLGNKSVSVNTKRAKKSNCCVNLSFFKLSISIWKG